MADRRSTKPRPLTAREEAAWRAFVQAMLLAPRVVEADLLESSRLNLIEYHVLAYLSERPSHALRMSELSTLSKFSQSGMTRVVERLSRDGLIEKIRSETDGRGQVAVLTEAGLQRLKDAWPDHVTSVRARVMDHLRGVDLAALTRDLEAIAAACESPAPRRR
jgi:DNA-binding MarR family transcriptional regulator